MTLDRDAQERLASLGYVSSASSLARSGGRPDPKDRLEAFQADRRVIARTLAAFRRNDSAEIIRILTPLAQRKDVSPFVASYLGRALMQIPERERQILSLYYEHELTLAEIGEVIGVGESRVSQIRTQAIARLRVSLRESLQLSEGH